MPHYKLIYFNVRGLAEPCRWVFAYKGVEYEDVRLPPALLTPELKQELNLPWGQLPILEIDGKQRLGQSRSMMIYLGKKFSLIGKDDWEEAQVNEIVDACLMDYIRKWFPVFQETDVEKKEALKNSLIEKETPEFFTKIEKRLTENGTDFFVGDSLTVADIFAAHFINHFGICVDVNLAKGFPKLEQLVERVMELPGIKEWIAKRPITQY